MKRVGLLLMLAVLSGCGESQGERKSDARSDSPDASIDVAQLRSCSAIKASEQRLACYDRALKTVQPSVLKPTPFKGVGKWQVGSKIDPITDNHTYFATLTADTGRTRMGDAPSLIVRCDSLKAEVFIAWRDYLGSGTVATVHRFDKDGPINRDWAGSSDNTMGFYSGVVNDFIKRLASSSTFVASVTPYNENPITAVFNTGGAEAAFKDILKACP